MNSSSATDSNHPSKAEWEWWMLVIIGFVGTAVVAALIMGFLCLLWRYCHCCQRNVDRRDSDSSTREKHIAGRRRSGTATAQSTLPSRRSSFSGEADVEAVQSSSQFYSYSLRRLSTQGDGSVNMGSKDGGEEVEQEKGWSDKPAPSPLLKDALAEAAESRSPPFEDGVNVSPTALAEPSQRAPAPEDVFVAVTSAESPAKRMRRYRSIASHMGGGLSHDESLRLHLMRHADTSDPFFGAFVKSSRPKSS